MALQFVNMSVVSVQLSPLDVPHHQYLANDDASMAYRLLDKVIEQIDDVNGTQPSNSTTFLMSSPFVSFNYSTPMMVVVAVVLSIVIIFTIFGNLLVAISLFRFRSLRTVSNFLIGNLALSDLMLATAVLPLSTVNECLGHWVFGRAACNVWLLVDVLCCTASLWNICIIALDRFTATLYPIWYRERRSTHQALLYVALVWTISTAVCLPPLFGWNDLANNYERDNVTDVYRCNLFQTPSYVLYSASMSFFVPFFLTVFLYVQIFIVLRERMRKMRINSSSSRSGRGTLNVQATNRAASSTAGSHHQAPRSAIATGSSLTSDRQQQLDENRHLIRPERAVAHGITIGAESSITVIEMATFDATPACSRRRSTDQTSIKSLCSDIGISDNSSTAAAAAAGQQQIVICVAASDGDDAAQSDARQPAKSNNTSSTDCMRDLIRHVTRSFANRKLKTVDVAEDDEDSGNGTADGLIATRRRTSGSDNKTRFDDDGDIRTALMAISTPGTPEVTATLAGPVFVAGNVAATAAVQQRRRQRFRRFTTGSSSAFRMSTSSTTADPRGATMKTSAARRFEQREIQATIRMAIIIAFFCGMWLGFFTVYVIQSWCPVAACSVPRALEAFFFWLGYSNSSINPILYTIFNEDFRRAFRKLIGCQSGNGGGVGGRNRQLAGSRIIDRHGGRDASMSLKNDGVK